MTVLPRSIESPKIHVVDSGIGAYTLRLSAANMKRLDHSSLAEFGHLLESFVVQDAIRQTTWVDCPVSAGYWRTRDNVEVDLVLERHDGAVVAIDVEAGDHVKRTHLAPLVALRDRLGSSFVAGVTFCTVATGCEVDDRIRGGRQGSRAPDRAPLDLTRPHRSCDVPSTTVGCRAPSCGPTGAEGVLIVPAPRTG
ncbi:DUF4143 domain-containing protein [Isoptericola haloaureus]|uniref:DUF4143 domain-containing protein n=1 Tax=Isoptericola haloaureus TaxID=1542902 RepID=A0ABU7Z3I0_9MICO